MREEQGYIYSLLVASEKEQSTSSMNSSHIACQLAILLQGSRTATYFHTHIFLSPKRKDRLQKVAFPFTSIDGIPFMIYGIAPQRFRHMSTHLSKILGECSIMK
jgi:hypothetical protein